MKKSTLAILMMTAVLASQPVWARDRSWSSRPSYTLTPVTLTGSFRCEEKLHETGHRNNHECDLRFVNEENGEEWNIKDNPTLSVMHQKFGGPVKAKISAMSSPRFLLGGSFVEVSQIQVLSNGSASSPASE